MAWENYGDVTFMKHGGLFIARDTEVSGNCYYVLRLDFVTWDTAAPYWLIADMWVDLSENWIDWSAVGDCMGLDESEESDIDKVIGAVSYYGPANFGADINDEYASEDDVMEYLRDRGCID